jgi:hypothetical protein
MPGSNQAVGALQWAGLLKESGQNLGVHSAEQNVMHTTVNT